MIRDVILNNLSLFGFARFEGESDDELMDRVVAHFFPEGPIGEQPNG